MRLKDPLVFVAELFFCCSEIH